MASKRVTEAMNESSQSTVTAATTFRQVHLRYRRQPPPPTLEVDNGVVDVDTKDHDWRTDVLDLLRLNPGNSKDDRVERIRIVPPKLSGKNTSVPESLVVYRLTDYPGCLLLPNLLSVSLQYRFAHRAVTHYCVGGSGGDHSTPLQQQPQQHATNLSSLPQNNSNYNNKSKHVTSYNVSLWDEWKQAQQRRQSTSKLSSTPLLEKLSWSTMGYHYDWTNRSYPPQLEEEPPLSSSPSLPSHFSPMPREIQQMASFLADATRSYYQDLEQMNSDDDTLVPDSQWKDQNYQATACIVNYYNTKSVMGIHRDEIELALHQPVISISIGCSAIFLFGRTTLDGDGDNDGDNNKKQEQKRCPPIIPILVRSGDVIIFGGPNRLNYHSMPRIIPQSFLDNNDRLIDTSVALPQPRHIDHVFDDKSDFNSNIGNELSEDEMDAVKDYLSNHRININIRQVY